MEECPIRRMTARLGVAAARWPLQAHLNDARSPRVGAEELPTPKRGLAAVLGDMPDEAERAGLGPVLWWYLSGVTHSASYGLMQAVEAHTEQDPLSPTLGAIFTDARAVILMGWAMATGFVTMTEARMKLFGWQSTEWGAARKTQQENFAQFRALL